MKSRLGEINQNKLGEKYIISEYRSAEDIDVIFKDSNNVKTGVTYEDFIKGHIFDSKNIEDVNLVGLEEIDNEENVWTVIEQTNNSLVIKREKDGEIICGVNRDDFLAGKIKDNFFVYDNAERSAREHRNLTLQNTLYLLNYYRRCVIVRPCGFGKTWIGIKLFNMPQYKKCLFLIPNDDAYSLAAVEAERKLKIKKTNEKLDIKTYQWLATRTDEQIKKMDYDIVFFDECHRIGGTDDGDGAFKTYIAAKKLMMCHPATHFVGATATPNRMDGINVITDLFLGHLCYPYTEEDAVEDGILKEPKYVCNYYKVKERIDWRIKERAKTVTKKLTKEELERIYNYRELEEIDADNMPKHIRKTCDEEIKDTSYMRFIVFYLRIDDIKENKDKVISWFKEAYPEHNIYDLEVHSNSKDDLKTLAKLPTQKAENEKGRIDLIFNCEMLCLSYHSDFLTGVLMERKTRSLIKYKQMVGRLLSLKNNTIVFDIVDNLHSDFETGKVRKPINISIEEIKEAAKLESNEELPNNLAETTFESIRKSFKKARDWSKLKKKTKKKSKQTEVFEKVFEFTKDKSLDEGIKVYNKALDVYSLNEDREESLADDEEQVNVHKDIKQSDIKEIEEITGVKIDEIKEEIKEEVEESGYEPGTFLYKSGRMFSKKLELDVVMAELDEIITRIFKAEDEVAIKRILENFHNAGYEDYTKEEIEDGIDVNTNRFKVLKAYSEYVEGYSVGLVIDEMYKINNC